MLPLLSVDDLLGNVIRSQPNDADHLFIVSVILETNMMDAHCVDPTSSYC
jgi:hypothetical protein